MVLSEIEALVALPLQKHREFKHKRSRETRGYLTNNLLADLLNALFGERSDATRVASIAGSRLRPQEVAYAYQWTGMEEQSYFRSQTSILSIATCRRQPGYNPSQCPHYRK
jgi:hypothetical protein